VEILFNKAWDEARRERKRVERGFFRFSWWWRWRARWRGV
jgi:hypothetical protein